MSDREAFEKQFLPSYCYWDGTKYAPDDDYDPDSYQAAHRFNMAWQAWQAAQAQASKPIAAVHGWFHGECVIRPLDPSMVIPVGMALYAQPQTIPDCHGIANGKRTEDMSNKELRYHMQELSAICYRQADEIEALKAQAQSGDGEAVIQRLRGQLQNCVNHIERLKRHHPRETEKLEACVQSANKCLYETLHDTRPQQAKIPEGWEIHAKVNAPADIKGQRIIGYRVTLPEGVFSEATDYLPSLTRPQPVQVNQQLLEALQDLIAYVEQGIGDTESDEGLKAKAAIAAAQEGK